MKKLARIVSFSLCLVMLISMMAACNGNSADQTVDLGSLNTSAPPVIGDEEHVSEYKPSGNRYDGEDFIVLVSNKDSNVLSMFDYKEDDPTLVDRAIKTKNAYVTNDYGVNFVTVKDAGGSNTGAQKMTKAYSSGMVEYHLAYIDSYSVVSLAVSGALYDLSKIDGIDLKNEWWDQRANTDLSINGQTYFTTGDIDVWDDMQQFIMIFNRTLFEQKVSKYTVDEFYDLAESGNWTYDEFYELGNGIVDDTNGDGIMNNLDMYGMITWDDTIYSVFSSTGAKVVSNENDTLTLGMIGDEKSINCMTKYTEWTQQNAYNYSRDGNGSKALTMFKGNQALFFMGRLSSLDNYRNMDSDFGLVPVPKYTVDDEYYVTVSPYHMSMVCTLGLEEGIDMRGEVIESCAYYSSVEVTPAYREKTLEGTNIRDEGSLMVLQLLAKNRIYDIGFYISPGDIQKQLIVLYRDWSTGYAAKYEEKRDQAEQAIADVAGAYAELATRS